MRSAEAPVRTTEAATLLACRLDAPRYLHCHKTIPLPNACDSEAIDCCGAGTLELRRGCCHGRARGNDIIDEQQALAPHILDRLVHAPGMLPAFIATELSLVTMTVFDQDVQQRHTRKIAKRARDCFHMVESTPPKRCRSRGHKYHRVGAGQHTAVAIGGLPPWDDARTVS
mgnify:CR=1 FL=1